MKTIIIDSYGVIEKEESLKLIYRPMIYKRENDELKMVDIAFDSEEAEFKNRVMLDNMLDILRDRNEILWWQDKDDNIKLIHPAP
jgi:hypothetical protein